MKIDENCTIIIPTYNRPDYLKRILNYYNEFGGKNKIIVADSSLPKNKEENRKNIQLFPNLEIKYLGDYPYTINPYHKFDDALKHVKSQYCVMCADDDFITPNGINQSINFLKNNSDYSVAHGVYVSFFIKKSNENKPHLIWSPSYNPNSIDLTSSKDRFYHHLANYSFPTFYAVHRTYFLKMILGETVKYTDDGRFGELLPTLLTAIYGKIKCLDVLYEARDAGSSSEYRLSINDFIKEGTYNKKYTKFRNCLAMHLSQKSQLEIEESNRVVDDAISAYMKENNYNSINKISDILHYLRVPSYILRGIRYIYKKLVTIQRKSFTSKYLTDNDFPSSYYYDLDKIRFYVLLSFQDTKGDIYK